MAHPPPEPQPSLAPEDPIRLVLGGGSLLHRTARELNTVVERRLAPFGITAQQAALLLSSRTANSPARLAATLGNDTAGMTRLLDRMEDKGLLRRVRHPDDRRSVLIELTEPGRALLPCSARVFGSVTRQLLTGFSDHELRQVTAMLQRMLSNLALRNDPVG